MAKNRTIGKQKEPTKIALGISVVTIATIVIGLWTKNPYWIIAGIVPAGLYEAWRTEGYYTKTASIAIVVLVILEILAILGIIRFNLVEFFQAQEMYLAGYIVPLGDIASIFPLAAALASLILVRRTYGPYTKWLAILLVASSVALLYIVNKEILPGFLRENINSASYWFY